MYVGRQLNLWTIVDDPKSPLKVLLQRNNSKWVAQVLLHGKISHVTQDEAVKHIETTLARSLFNCDEL